VMKEGNTLSVQKNGERYKNKEMMKGIYGGFETCLNKYGKEITVAKNFNKILHSVMASWTSKDTKRKLGKSAELESNESKDKEDKEYCSDKNNNLLSRTLSREVREKQKRNKDRNVSQQMDNNKRNNNATSGNSEDSKENMNNSGSRNKIKKRQKGRKGNERDSAKKVTRSSTRGESGIPGTML
jgi:hypothetical protein